jgi:predicted ABC-type transport system involved in lysophospholipase L1 biosynthesis ATPase subunit
VTQSPLVALEHVGREFDGGRVTALKDVSLEIAKGESLSIVGTSGSGKTTLIMLMCGIMVPSEGVVRWNGEPVASPKEWSKLRRTEIGIVFQDFNLFPTLSANENIEVATFGTGIDSAERKRRAEAALEAVGLSARATHLPHQLSGGERQRVAIARSIVNRPAAIFADEPTGNLDSINGKQIVDLLFDLHKTRGVTLVLVSHDTGLAAACARQVGIKDGRLSEKPSVRLREAAR